MSWTWGSTKSGDQSDQKGHYDPDKDVTHTGVTDILQTSHAAVEQVSELVDCSSSDCNKLKMEIYRSILPIHAEERAGVSKKKTVPNVASQALFRAIETNVAKGEKIVLKGDTEPLSQDDATAMRDFADADDSQCVIC